MPRKRIEIKVASTTVRKVITLTRKGVIDMINYAVQGCDAPLDADVYVDVPEGGDEAGQRVRLDESDYVLTVTWEVRTP